MISSKEILENTDIGSAKTLTRWHQRGLIPAPVVTTHPCGRGKMSYWPSWVPWRIREVRSRLERGDGLDKIAEDLGSDWEAEEQRWTRQRRSLKRAVENQKRADARDRFAETVATRVYDLLQAMGVQRPGVFARLEEVFADLKLVTQAVQLTRDGFNVVAVIVGEDIHITTDFVVGRSLAAPEAAPVLVVPLGTIIREAFSEIEKDLPEAPVVVASDVVDDSSIETGKSTTFSMKKDWTFALKRGPAR